jgi:hypothetical protein
VIESTSLISLISIYISQLVIAVSPYAIPFVSILVIVSIAMALYQLIRLIVFFKNIDNPYTILELQPLKKTIISPYTTQQLFTVIHGLSRQQTLVKRIFNLSKTYAFEISSSKLDGIKYVVRVPKEDADLVRKTLVSYLPGLQISKIKEIQTPTSLHSRVTTFKLSRPFIFPLLHQESLETYDPIAYITGSMTKLSKDEAITFQIVLSPLNKAKVPVIARILNLFRSGKDLGRLKEVAGITFLPSLIVPVLQIALLPVGVLVLIFSGGKEGPWFAMGPGDTKKIPLTSHQTELENAIKHKLEQPLFTTSIRLKTSGNSLESLRSRERSVISALSTLSYAENQSLITTLNINVKAFHRIKYWLFTKRIITPFSSLILSATEIADLYHLPHTDTTKTEDLTKQQSKELPSPLSLKKSAGLDIIFAKNQYGGNTTPIGLAADERRRHMYILGATGTGKSTLLLSMLKEDVDHGKGLCLIDPHGDLVEQVLSIIPKSRIKDVVYFNPDDIGYPIGINLLELTPGLTDDEAIREKEFIAESIISVFHKIYSDRYSGPRMEYILRNTIHTAFTLPEATLFTVYKLLINTTFRKQVVRNITDDNLKEFWKYEFNKAGDYQKVKMISPITNKIGRFLFSPTAKRILEQPKSTISFDTIMNEGKILICNLAKGKVGEDNSSVFGVLVMAKVQLAALKRARMKQADRKDFYLYVDEFQNFATQAFAQILSEARKYRLNAILAHQTTSQIEDSSLVNVTLANTGTVICFRTANPEDERVILPQFRPYVELGEISSLPSYHFYMRLGALNPEEPFSGVTMPVMIQHSQERVDEVIESSRKLYASRYVPINNDELSQTNIPEKTSSKQIRRPVP